MNPTENKQSSAFLRLYVLAAVLFLGFVGGLVVGRNTNDAVVSSVNGGTVAGVNDEPLFLLNDVDFDLFWQVWEVMTSEYVDQPINEAKLLYGAISGMVASVGDPHTIFFDPELTKEFNADLEGKFEGIGAEIAVKNKQLVVVAPLPGTPAERAGIKAGDRILAIDGVSTEGMTVDAAVSKIRGKGGTEVSLMITRDGLGEAQEFKIVRDTITIISVEWEMLPSNIAHIKLHAFNQDTEKLFNGIVPDVIKKNPKGIILDLRGDPGGLLDTSIVVASAWVEDGVVVSEKFYDGSMEEHRARGKALFADFPTVVLINEGSASASEIVAGALQDYGKAKIIGVTSFGKGSVQTLYDFDEGSSLKLTIAKWLTPLGHMIDGVGITPDAVVELTDEDWNADKDPQLDAAITALH